MTVSKKGVTAVVGDWDNATAFVAEQAPQLVEANAATLSDRMRAAKMRYVRDYSDLLELRLGDRTIGVCIGQPEDWSTYYCRVIAIDPEFGSPNMARNFGKRVVFPPLISVGVERVVGETPATNTIMHRYFVDVGFHPSGHRLTDRWGTLVRFTKHLDERAARTFSVRYSPTLPEIPDANDVGEQRNREGT